MEFKTAQILFLGKTITWHVHRAFLYSFFAVVVRLRRETSQFHVIRRTGTQDNDFLFLL